jgi:hypothetical protein
MCEKVFICRPVRAPARTNPGKIALSRTKLCLHLFSHPTLFWAGRRQRPPLGLAIARAARVVPCSANRAYNIYMYHYNPSTALEELTEEATLPNPVHVRDMMLRRKLTADQALELNRIFLEYQKFFGETQKLGKEILKRLAG